MLDYLTQWNCSSWAAAMDVAQGEGETMYILLARD